MYLHFENNIYIQDFIDDMIVILYESKLNFVGKSFS